MRVVFIRGVLRLLALLPLPLCHGLGAVFGWFCLVFPNSLLRTTRANIDGCFPELDPRKRRGLVRASLRETGKTIMEFGPLWYWSAERTEALVKELSGVEVLDAAATQGKGVLIAGPHLGAWEMAGFYCACRYPMSSLYRRPRMAELDDVIREARERGGATLVATDTGGLRSLYRALKEGRLLGILPDQEPKSGAGVFAPFFGVPALTMVLLARLARKSGAPVVFTFAERLSWGRGYRMHFLPAPEGIDDRDPDRAAAALNEGVEQCVRIAPEQYQWTYKRFRARPAGEPTLY